jgi:hypothetical protein
MPIPIEEFVNPSFIRLRTRYTIAGIENQRARFMKFEQYPRRYRHGYFPQAGYNPNHQSTRVERVRLDNDSITLKPR